MLTKNKRIAAAFEMKKVFVPALAFAAVLGSPAFAQSFSPEIGSGNIVGSP